MNKIINFLQQKKLAAIIIVLVLTSLVYSNILNNEFVWDDPDFYGNWPALYSFKNIPNLLAGELPPQHEGNYRPVRSIFQLFIFQSLGGEKMTAQTKEVKNAFGYHLISLIIHLISVVAVYLIIELLTKKRILAFLTALIFGLHPIHIEAITYLTTSIDEIGAVFFLWALYLYLKSQNSLKKWLLYISSVIFAWLAFFSYEITLVLPLIIILVDLYRQNFHYQNLVKKIKLYLPYFAGVLFWLILRTFLKVGLRSFSGVMETTLFSRLLTTTKAIMKYIYLLFWPQPLNVYHKINISHSLIEPKVLLSILAIIGLLLIAIFLAKKRKIISFSILWFFICLAPVANVFPTGIIMAEKYTYLVSISACLILAWLIYLLIKADRKIFKALGLIITLIIAIFYGSLTYAQNSVWQSDEILWQKTLELRPDYGRVYNNIGFVYSKQKKYDQAIEYFEKAKELEPNLAIIYQNLGNIYDEMGKYDQAITNYEKAIELGGELAETYNNLGVTYQNLGQFDQAITNYEKAVDHNHYYFLAYSNLGVIYLLREDWSRAKENFQAALELNSNFGQAHHGLAVAYINEGEITKAINHYKKSIASMPELTDNYNHLASIYNQQGNRQKATQTLEQGVKANPNSAELHTNLGILLANDGQLEKAVQQLEKALELDPNYQQALQVLSQINPVEN